MRKTIRKRRGDLPSDQTCARERRNEEMGLDSVVEYSDQKRVKNKRTRGQT